MDNNILTKGYTNSEWEVFVKGELIVFMTQNNIEKITVKILLSMLFLSFRINYFFFATYHKLHSIVLEHEK